MTSYVLPHKDIQNNEEIIFTDMEFSKLATQLKEESGKDINDVDFETKLKLKSSSNANGIVDLNILDEKLIQFNTEKSGITQAKFFQSISKGLKQNEKVVGGISGFVELECALKIELLWIDESLGGQNIGEKLLNAIENEAKQIGATFSYVETFDFQAKHFYEKYGYEIFGQLEYSTGNSNYFLRKLL